MISAWVRSTACFTSLKTSCGLVRIDAVSDFDARHFDWGRGCAGFDFVAAERAVLESGEPGGFAGEADVGGELALEHLASEGQLSVFVLEADAVADHGASHGGGEFRDEIAHLIGVRHEHELGLFRGEELFERGGEGVGSVGLELRRLDGVDFRDLFPGYFCGQRADAGADYGGFEGPSGGGGEGLARGDSFPGDAVEFGFALFDDD